MSIGDHRGIWRLASRAWLVMTVVLFAAALLLNPAAAQEPRKTGKDFAVAYAARVVGDENRTRLVVDFDKKTDIETMYLENPDRVIFDLPETVFSFSKNRKERIRGLVSGFRYGTIAPGRSRIVLLTSAPVQVEQYSVKPLEKDGRFRLKLDLVKTSRDNYRNAIFLQSGTLGNSGNVAYKGNRIRRGNKDKSAKFTVVIDPGHGGIDGGAEGLGRSIEKTITLGFSLALERELQKFRDISVLLTRDRDVFVSLSERVAMARRNQADLMISVHADSLKQRSIRGATIYTLSAEGSDELARSIAENENRSDLFAGLALPAASTEVADILIDLTRRETELFSTQFASTLVTRLKGRIPLIKNPHRSANFQVLRAPEIPSVLLELGYLSNTKDEKQMTSSRWQTETARFVGKAIMAFQRTHGNGDK